MNLRGCLWAALVVLFAAGCTDSRTQPASEPVDAVKIFVSESGMYEVSAADLEKAGAGWEAVDPMQDALTSCHADVIASVSEAISYLQQGDCFVADAPRNDKSLVHPPMQLRLTHQGQPRPLWVQQQGEAFVLRFYGRRSQSRYASENVYVLHRDGGLANRMEERPVTGQSSRESATDHYLATARVEMNRLYSPKVEEGDHWFWASLPAPSADTFDVTATAVAPGPGLLRLGVWGSTEAATSPDHHLRIAVNGEPVADETWDGRGHHVIEADLPAELVREGVNEVTVQAPGDTGVAADVTYVDWIEIQYPRFFVAEEDRLTFESPGGPHRLTGFTGTVTVFDVTDLENVGRLIGVQEQRKAGQTTVAFDGDFDHRYVAVGSTGYRQPARVAPVVSHPDLRAPETGADYVAIGPPDLLEPLQPLLQRREKQGLRVLTVPVEAVYDQFNGGVPEPEAIRAFLKHARQSWQPAPQYLLLVGDATYDPRGYSTPPEANRVPSFLIPTVFGGETASDTAFALLDDDAWPDVAVGRMPARSPQQISALVEKILAYEQSAPAGPWRHRILAVADGQNPSFRADARGFLGHFSDTYEVALLSPEASATNASAEVRDRLGEGNLLVTYFGHGSVTQWGKDRLFTAADTAALDHGERLPVVLNMTCLTGLFTHPKVESLAETLLWQPQGGAVAVLAPTSLTLPTDQSFLSESLAQVLLDMPEATFGQVLLQAQRQVPAERAGARDVMYTFLLFGDPALRLAHP